MAAGPLLTSAAVAAGSTDYLLYTTIVLSASAGLLVMLSPARDAADGTPQ